MKKTILTGFVVLLLLAQPVFAKAPDVGDKAPDFTVTALADDAKVSLSKLKGKIILLGMFHICVPCQQQALEFEKVRQALPSKRLVIMGVNTNGDSKAAVQDYLKSFPAPISFPYYTDPEKGIHKAYIQRDMPSVLIIGNDGLILSRTPAIDAEQLIDYLKRLVEG